jgi:predicted nucleic acid-binding protein
VIVVLDTNVIVAALVAKGLCHEDVVRPDDGSWPFRRSLA